MLNQPTMANTDSAVLLTRIDDNLAIIAEMLEFPELFERTAFDKAHSRIDRIEAEISSRKVIK